MMQTHFLCLANSKKYTQRCIAGIVLQPTPSGKHNIVRQPNGNPRWIRPVARNETGEVPEKAVKHIKLLDIVEMSTTEAHPQGHQQENWFFENEVLPKLRSVPPDPAILDKLVTPAPAGLFGDVHAAIGVDQAAYLDHSLLLVKVTEATPRFAPTSTERVQVRLTFSYGNMVYDLPITDIDFRLLFYKDCFVLRRKQHVYCTISLGQAYNGYYYKLVAGVIYC